MPYTAVITVMGGLAPTTIVSIGGLPAGLGWNSSEVTGTPTAPGTNVLTVTAQDARGLIQTSNLSLVVQPAPSYTIPDQGKGKITSIGDYFIYVGTKKIIWNASTRFTLRGATIEVGMVAQWKGKRDPVSGVVFASRLEIN